MRPDDLLVEVRDVHLRRRGAVPSQFLVLDGGPVFLGVGEWTLTLPADVPEVEHLVEHLREPGAGVIVTHLPSGRVLWSGPVRPHTLDADRDTPGGTYQFSGTTDEVVLWNHLALPDPSRALDAQTTRSHDVRTGLAETVLYALVRDNIAEAAPAARRIPALTTGLSLGRGGTVTRSLRFDTLGDALADIAAAAGLGFRVVQVDDHLEFQVYAPRDRRGFVRLDLRAGTLASQAVEVTPVGLTRALVAGQGEGEHRTLVEVTSPAALAAEAAWGPWGRVERFLDQRQTDDPTELTQAGDKAIAEAVETVAVTAVPSDATTMAWPTDWDTGDLIAVVITGQEVDTQVTGVRLIADDQGVRVGAAIGDVVGWSPVAAVERRVDDLASRISAVERNEATGLSGLAEAVQDLQDEVDDHATTLGTQGAAITALGDRLDPLEVAQVLGDTDLNTLTDTGLWYQGSNSEATAARGYPPTGQYAGFLEVIRRGANLVMQRYTTYPTYGTRTFTRMLWGGTWGPWRAAGPLAGVRSVSFTTRLSHTINITFPFGAFDNPPVMSANIASGAGEAGDWQARAINVTASGFTLLLWGPSAAWSSIPVHWTAQEAT